MMEERRTGLGCHYDDGSSTLALSGTLSRDDWPRLCEEIDRAFRRTACRLTVDLAGMVAAPAHEIGRLVQLCNRAYPGTMVRPPVYRPVVPRTPVAPSAA